MSIKYKVLILIFVLSIATLRPSCAGPQGQESFTIGARAVSQPGLPLEISGVFANSNSLAKETSVSFKLSNHAGSTLRRLKTKILWLDDDKKVLGGQIHTQILDTPSESAQMIQQTIKIQPQTYFDRGEFVLVVTEVISDGSVWQPTMSNKDLTAAMKANKPVPMTASNKMENSASIEGAAGTPRCFGSSAALPQGGCGTDFCVECHILAIDDCYGCILSYHCNGTTCDCSFTCRTDPPCGLLSPTQVGPQSDSLIVTGFPALDPNLPVTVMQSTEAESGRIANPTLKLSRFST